MNWSIVLLCIFSTCTHCVGHALFIHAPLVGCLIGDCICPGPKKLKIPNYYTCTLNMDHMHKLIVYSRTSFGSFKTLTYNVKSIL